MGDMIRSAKTFLTFLRERTEESRDKFREEAFGTFFQRMVNKEIDEAILLMDCFIRYTRMVAPVLKKDTVYHFIEEILKKNRKEMEEKEIGFSKVFEQDLPETTLSDEQVRFVLDSILHYAIVSVPPHGKMQVTTKTYFTEKCLKRHAGPVAASENRIEIRVIFTDDREAKTRSAVSEISFPEGGERMPLELRLAEQMIRRNDGVLGFKVDEESGKAVISARLPVERRRYFYYHSDYEPGRESDSLNR
jgi:hypothetical protein